MANIPHKPTKELRKLVSGLTVLGESREYMASRIGISTETLNKYYDYELNHYTKEVDCYVVDKLMEHVNKGVLKAIMFYLTHRTGWYAAKPKDEQDSLSIKSLAEAIMLAKENVNDGKQTSNNE